MDSLTSQMGEVSATIVVVFLTYTSPVSSVLATTMMAAMTVTTAANTTLPHISRPPLHQCSCINQYARIASHRPSSDCYRPS
jgi:hypothetical protein